MLGDGAWDAWTFAPSFAPALPDNPLPAPISSTAGDFDRDLDADGADLLLLQQSHGLTVGPFGAGADGDRSGIVDGDDLAIWRQYFGAASIASSHATRSVAVPEPPTLSICCAAALIMVLLRHSGKATERAYLLSDL
jgi:hypothetical protein